MKSIAWPALPFIGVLATALVACGPNSTTPDGSTNDVADANDVSLVDAAPETSDVPVADAPIDSMVAETLPDDVTDALMLDVPSDTTSVDAFDGAADAFDVAPDTVAMDAPPFDVPLPDSFVVDGSTVCNATVNDAAPVTFAAGTGTPPAPTGGTIIPGHYQLTSIVLYGGTPPPALTLQEAIDITSTAIFVVGAGSGMPEVRSTLSYTVSGTTMNTTTLCPMPATASNGFSADPTHLVISQVSSGETVIGTFTLH